MLLLTSLLGAAAAIHFANAPAHFHEWAPLGTAFLLVGWAQAALAVWVSRTPSRKALLSAAAVSGASVATWAMSRTVGLPFGPDAGVAEAVGTADLVCVALEGLTLVLAVAAIPLRPIVVKLASSVFPALAVVGVASLALAAPSTHEHTHDEAEVHEHTASDLDVALADADTVSAREIATKLGFEIDGETRQPTRDGGPRGNPSVWLRQAE